MEKTRRGKALRIANAVLAFCLLLSAVCLISACDPKYPPGKLKVRKIGEIAQGDEVEVEIIYPTGGICVIGWKDQRIEIVDGADVISVSGLKITGLKPGTATVKVSATTIIVEEDLASGSAEEKVYSVLVKIKVTSGKKA